MTFNIRNGRAVNDGANLWWRRRSITAAVIAEVDADVLGVQEAYHFQLAYLLRQRPGFAYVGQGRNDAKGRGEHAPVLFRSERFALERAETRWLSDTPTVPGSRSWGNRFPRIVTVAWLRERVGGGRLGMVNGHFDSESAEARVRSAQAVVDLVAGERDRPWVVMGDFNTTAEDPAVQLLLGAGFSDTLGSLPPHGPGAGTEHAYTGRTDRTRIDFILLSPGLRALDAAIVTTRPKGRLPSDHWPVTATMAT